MIQHCLDQRYRFISYSTLIESNEREKPPWLLLRHDVDLAPVHAAELARVNEKLGVSGTFFFQLDATQYNLLDRINSDFVRRIADSGQLIGLHFSIPESEAGFTSILDEIKFSFEILRSIAGQCDNIVAWHNPSIAGVSKVQDINRLISGKIPCTYNPPFAGEEVTYLSDSLMRRSPRELLQALDPRKAPCVQLCLHPVFWVLGGKNVPEVFLKNIHRRILHAADEHDLLAPWREISSEFHELIEPLRHGKIKKE